MGRTNIVVLFFFSFIYLGSMTYLVNECYDKNEKLIELNRALVSVLDFNERILDFEEWVTESEAQSKLDHAEKINQEINDYNDYLVQYGYVIVFVSLLYLLILYFSFNSKKRLFVLIFTGIFVSIVVLLHGVFNPIMEIGAYQDDIEVKAKLSPIKLEGYEYSKNYADSLNKTLELKIDSALLSVKNEISVYDSSLLEVKNTIENIEALIRVMPFIDQSVKEKIKDLSNKLNKMNLSGFIPFDQISKTIKEFNLILLDSVKNRADLYAGETYGFDKKFKGRTYFYYEIKSIFSVIKTLWESENYLVSICVGLFSIVVPLIKILLSLFILLARKIKGGILVRFVSSISKWSMADVFVLAAFLSYLSFSEMRTGINIEANLKYGFYFFLMYVIFSLILSVLLKRHLKNQESIDMEAQSVG